MGFDPRQGPFTARTARPITGNLDVLLQENAALKQEVLRLRRMLERYQHLEREPQGAARPRWVSPEQLHDWARALSQQPGWSHLRSGDALSGLEGLLAQLNRSSFLPQLSLEQRLDRLAPGLGHDLQAALTGLRSKQRLAVLVAFALYGVSAREWLADDPARVVADLRQRVKQLEQQRSRQPQPEAGEPRDPRRMEAYQVLGLPWGASREAIKKAHRRLVKQHHPDLGGTAEAFRRVNAAYQLLIA